MTELHLLLLILVANGAPVLATRLFGAYGARALDGGRRLPDGRPLFGSSKTWRGLLAALACTVVVAWMLGFAPRLGFAVGAGAMLGDLGSSFVKRRLGLASSSRALGLDQIPESLLPLLAVREALGLDATAIAALVAAFVALELLLSRLLYRLHIRKQPY